MWLARCGSDARAGFGNAVRCRFASPHGTALCQIALTRHQGDTTMERREPPSARPSSGTGGTRTELRSATQPTDVGKTWFRATEAAKTLRVLSPTRADLPRIE
jgi:hypothetical protein